MGNKAPISPERRSDRRIGLSIIFLAFAGCMGLSLWGMKISTPKPAPTPAPVSTVGLKGFPQEVRPFELLERARGLSHRSKFRGFVAEGVNSQGTVNLNEKKSSIRFVFQSPEGRGHQPEREPGTLPDRRYCGTQSVIVDSKGIAAVDDRADVACGSKDIEDIGVPETCTIEKLWTLAKKKKKFRAKESASVEYFLAHGGPAFRIKQRKNTLVISAADCKKEFKGRSARGSVPAR